MAFHDPLLVSVLQRFVLVELGLLLLTPLLLGLAWADQPPLVVGVVLVDDSDDHFADQIIAGYERFDSHFSARLLPQRFNASGVRVQHPFQLYLNFDIITQARPLALARQYGVDLILLLTDHRMSDWDGQNTSIWGQAYPEQAAILMSTAFLDANDTLDDLAARQIALHETLHLLGYTHDTFYQHGLMGYGEYRDRRPLLTYQRYQLPLRSHVATRQLPSDFIDLVALTRLAWALTLMPFYLGLEGLAFQAHRRRLAGSSHLLTLRSGLHLASLGLLTLVAESLLVLAMPPLLCWMGYRLFRSSSSLGPNPAVRG